MCLLNRDKTKDWEVSEQQLFQGKKLYINNNDVVELATVTKVTKKILFIIVVKNGCNNITPRNHKIWIFINIFVVAATIFVLKGPQIIQEF